MDPLDAFDYKLPPELIANTPANPRDHARLFIYDTATDRIHVDTVRHLDKYIPSHSLLVMNDTKVVPARLWLEKETGGKIEVLLSINEFRKGDTLIKGIVDRKLSVGAKLSFRSGATLLVVRQEEQFFFFRPSVTFPQLWKLLDREGHTPIPPYIKDTPLSEKRLRDRYQTIFAQHGASVAAPTASLHFTNRVFNALERKEVSRAFVTLNVGAGTFAPIDRTNFEAKSLFTEYCGIGKQEANTINRAKNDGAKIIPVGTTAMRTLESFATLYNGNWCVEPGEKGTNIFIFDPYQFKIADGLLTNFHVPRSSLLLLVDALLRSKNAKRSIIELYEIAINERFRFYSFGDAMLIL